MEVSETSTPSTFVAVFSFCECLVRSSDKMAATDPDMRYRDRPTLTETIDLFISEVRARSVEQRRRTDGDTEATVVEREVRFRHSGRRMSGPPLMVANMDAMGTFEMAATFAPKRLMVLTDRYYPLRSWTAFARDHPETMRYAALKAGGGGDDEADFDTVRQIVAAMPEVGAVCVDAAHLAYSQHFIDHVRRCRAEFPDVTIIAGNVCSAEMTESLVLAGADVVKVGVGGRDDSRTRQMTGVGRELVDSLVECAEAAHGLGAHVISDGGATCPQEVVQELRAGADWVLISGMLRGVCKNFLL